MASIFLSYDREDLRRASAVATALEEAGHQVWWDRHIKGGAQYSHEIEQALKEADTVVVLWSSASIDSAWVRDEAAAGRDSNRLVPARLDRSEPPLGFRQFQTIDLSRTRGRAATAGLAELVDAVGGSPSHARKPSRMRPSSPGLRVAAAVLLILGLLAAGWFAWTRWHAPANVPVVAIAAADSSPASAALARDLFVMLGTLEAAGTETIRLVEGRPEGGESADLLFEIGQARGTSGSANLALLSGPGRGLLWSQDFATPAGRAADLKEQTSFTAARVLSCALESLAARPRVDERLSKLYLKGCATLADYQGAYVLDALPTFLEVTRRAPGFRGGWSRLLLVEGQIAGNRQAIEDPSIIAALPRHIEEARRRFPDLPEVPFAEIELLPARAIYKPLDLTERAVAAHPHHPYLLIQRSLLLAKVGRMNEAVELARNAAEADPLSARVRGDYIAALAYAGKLDRAYQELARGEKLWPGSFAMADARYRIDSRYGDARQALEIERSGIFGDTRPMETFLLARLDPSPANVERVIAGTSVHLGRNPAAIGFLVQALGEFGRHDQLFDLLIRRKGEQGDLSGVLFRPSLARFRREPRFMQVAARFGLVDYWRRTGKWPDFCLDPELPYDCKAEAAKVVG